MVAFVNSLRLMEEIRPTSWGEGSLSHYLQGVIHPRWCRISSINSMFVHLFWEKSLVNLFGAKKKGIPPENRSESTGRSPGFHGCIFFVFLFSGWLTFGRSENWDGFKFVQRIGWQVGDVLIFLLLCWLYNKFAWFCWQISMKYCHCDRLHVFLLDVLTHDARKGTGSILCPEKSILQCVHFQGYNRSNDFVVGRPEREHTLPPYLAIISYTILSGSWNLT